jgi:transcriptional regulator with XRE-family HTH domain
MDVARNVGVKQAAVSSWERGVSTPRKSILLALARLYACTVDELLREDEPPPPADGAPTVGVAPSTEPPWMRYTVDFDGKEDAS